MLRGDGKVIIITGASSGIGRAMAREAARRGMKTALLARRGNLLDEISAGIIAGGGEALAIPTDVREAAAIREAFKKVDAEWGRLDILFNNAAVLEPVKPVAEIADEEWENSLKTNVLAVYIATRLALERMLRQETGGTIISITSGAAYKPYEGWAAYGSQKAAVDMFTRITAKEISGTKVRIAAISPGPVDTRMQRIVRESPERYFPSRQKFIDLHETGRLPKPEDVAGSLIEIALTEWKELSGTVDDIRSPEFRAACAGFGVSFT